MRNQHTYHYPDIGEFRQKLLAWASSSACFCYLDSCGNTSKYGKYETLVAVGAHRTYDSLASLRQLPDDWVFGFLTYDLKNEIEELDSANFDGIKMPLLHFFQPLFVFEINEDAIRISCADDRTKEETDKVFDEISGSPLSHKVHNKVSLFQRVSREEYVRKVTEIKEHIRRGDIYEMNYCIEFYSENPEIDPVAVYESLRKISPSPFSCFYKLKDKFLLCSSPERFIKKEGKKLVSQPIKGTVRRGRTEEEDKQLADSLRVNWKEQAENVMIVDLVRNDLSRIAEPGTVHVEELFGIYPFSQVHQMISTVSCSIEKFNDLTGIIKALFPMGSMTGAPKIRAMELIEQYETTKRGLYSGAVGYINSEKDFDFNVVIRSILYNATDKYLSYMVGSAITYNSDPEKEYEECLLKGKALSQALNAV